MNFIIVTYELLKMLFIGLHKGIFYKPNGKKLSIYLESLGPIFTKFGQLLSTRTDILDLETAKELESLTDSCKPFDVVIFKKIVESELGDSIENIFDSFEETPLAAASLAQVHSAKLKNGNEVVIKVLRPNIKKSVNKNLRLLKAAAKIFSYSYKDSYRLKPNEVIRDYESTILKELDLRLEASNTNLTRKNFINSNELYIPEVYWDLTTSNVMVLEKIDGIPCTDIKQIEKYGIDKKELAENGVMIFLKQVFRDNFFHADMHPGNIFIDATNPKSPTYIAIDCAIMGSLSSEDQFYMARNLLAMFQRDYRLVAELHIRSGWVPKDTSINDFTGAIRSVCEPIFQRPLSEISLGHMLIDLFATARRFNMEVQPSLVLLQKTLLNIEGLGRQLYPDLDLWQTAQPFLEQWMKDRYSPKSIFKQLKRYAPDWLEHFPQIPPMIFQALKSAKERDTNDIVKQSTSMPQQTTVWSTLLSALGFGSLGGGIAIGISQWSAALGQPPLVSLGLVFVGLVILVLRKP